VPGKTRSRTARLAALAALLTSTAASAALAAPGTADRSRPHRVGATAERLDTRIHQAVLGLYALDSRLAAWRGRVSSLTAAAAAIRRQRAALRQELGSAEAHLKVAQRELALHLRALYEQGNVDPVAVVLGATSLRTALQSIDDLNRVADQNRQVVAVTISARRRLLRSRLRLDAENRRLTRSLATAQRAEQRLAGAAAARVAYVASLRREELRSSQVRHVVATAHAVQQKSERLQPTKSPPPVAGSRKLVVSATCYDLPGTTATGLPVGWGVVAVDPSVIPLGTRLYVPGYGNGVAADVGGGIKGAVIDLWMPPARCAAWGRRTVTVTVY
jgi:3D (Asp-Asp-Asp) domain-containing protein/peptidoglycan hydrolase CwlO-like protein